ncbi:hypothetical protein SI65_04390 [Aspergillus cristatus]|uniref:Acyl-CoA thioesterase II n=1 Tax=Aspergillus cristatus TaxID=573508 RepID=A0A1E3BG78_ASPCR|nr:hypothetical protein SI65_04390 [Aspergillus cristatus]
MGVLASTVFGGNCLAVAVNAAYQTTSPSHHLYSICGHFVRAATTDRKLICEVETVRNTRTFETRLIRVTQEKADDGSTRLCLVASADFHIEEPRSMVTYTSAAQAISPLMTSNSSSSTAPRITLADAYGLYKYIEHFTDIRSISVDTRENKEAATEGVRPVPSKVSAERFRARGPLDSEAEQISALAFYINRGLAYIPANHSGYELLEASACATLDFALRIFTHAVNLQNWHVTEQKALVAENARAFSEGRVWDESGRLIVSMTQQTILRPRTGFKPRI